MKFLLSIFFPVFIFSSFAQATQISVSPYYFFLNPDTHQLHTTWEVRGASISFICTFAEVSLVELSWTGESKELSSGNSWAVTCEEGDVGDKMVIEVDVTKFRVQPFRSYKVCINLEDSPTNSHLDEVCSHLFSFEKYVPYRPEEEETEVKEDINKLVENNDYKAVKNTEIESLDDLISVINKENKESENKEIFIEKNETKKK